LLRCQQPIPSTRVAIVVVVVVLAAGTGALVGLVVLPPSPGEPRPAGGGWSRASCTACVTVPLGAEIVRLDTDVRLAIG
jgi:hypothetical protein